MGRLTAEHTAFLRRHGFVNPRDWTLNASGMTRATFSAALKQERKLFAYGVAPCRQGHTLRTAGGCPQCDTSYIAYAKRSRLAGYLYIAKSGQLTKVGFSKDASNRIYIANLEGYAGRHDWRLRALLYSASAGQLEIAAHRVLNTYCDPAYWIRSGKISRPKEVFRCSYDTARNAVLSVMTTHDISELQEFR